MSSHPQANSKQLYLSRQTIRWGDMDAFGHVNNTVYFRFMEQCRIEWLEEVFGPTIAGEEGPVIVNAHCNFRRQMKYPARICVEMSAGHLGRTSVETTYIIRDAADEQIIYADGAAKIVWVDFKKEKSTALPEQLRQLLTSL
ncbi:MULTISPECIES: acyl-CoA thioesterase [Herbaspirillum]|uniref:Thioesterase protein n=1 Tax=Herbaspirillum seropedicae (strain SmR1) TaxID=757424 RepID=D8IRH2_HERSS|nr:MULTISPECIES: thioesterase family protein [Herbaspirillum]ADJ63296.1 thioesterase protein [Herbaspirillum seropedicae SmR1]AKN65339.1 thioesterase [Herbaspirillum seropedicae]AON54114.1 thioesterase [Herbaspirillum seropedicae]MDR6394902.1 acyl-CoA thioester hydrolase [Herbaspirillum seropedicae]NQE31576.1 thioesterase [Herbaspirillum seropedicae]